jgi:ubiquinone/menaquinone biosynthesis C-methylase UbiE
MSSFFETGERSGLESYSEFAEVYDLFMDNVDYDLWCLHLVRRLREYGIRDGLVCELGCGTGAMTERLASSGYDMIGVDVSPEMLQEAVEKREKSGHDILYLLQDMREFELYGTVRAVVSVCDSMNYLTEPEDLLETFRLVNNYLDPGGIFLFDLNMAVKYEKIGNSTIAENRPQGSFIWENAYDPEKHMNEYLLTLFLPEGELFRKYEELHVQRAYPAETVKSLIEKAGMEFLSATEAYTDRPASRESERILFAARERGKRREI